MEMGGLGRTALQQQAGGGEVVAMALMHLLKRERALGRLDRVLGLGLAVARPESARAGHLRWRSRLAKDWHRSGASDGPDAAGVDASCRNVSRPERPLLPALSPAPSPASRPRLPSALSIVAPSHRHLGHAFGHAPHRLLLSLAFCFRLRKSLLLHPFFFLPPEEPSSVQLEASPSPAMPLCSRALQSRARLALFAAGRRPLCPAWQPAPRPHAVPAPSACFTSLSLLARARTMASDEPATPLRLRRWIPSCPLSPLRHSRICTLFFR